MLLSVFIYEANDCPCVNICFERVFNASPERHEAVADQLVH